MKTFHNSRGFIHFVALLIAAGVTVLGVIAGLVLDKNNQHIEQEPVAFASAPKEVKKPKESPKKKPIPVAKPQTIIPKPAITVKPKPTPAPKPIEPAKPQGKVYISSDGCWVTAIGKPGMELVIGAFKPNKGGSMTLTIPASGTIVAATGGFKGMTGFGKLYDLTGKQIGYGATTITAASCPPAGNY